MILFFNKKTKEIIGHIDGRIHPIDVQKTKLSMTGVPQKDIVKFVVPFKPNYKTVEIDKTEVRVVDQKTMRIEKVVVGKEKVRKQTGMTPNVSFADIITLFEGNIDNIRDFKVKLNEKGELIGFKRKSKNE